MLGVNVNFCPINCARAELRTEKSASDALFASSLPPNKEKYLCDSVLSAMSPPFQQPDRGVCALYFHLAVGTV